MDRRKSRLSRRELVGSAGVSAAGLGLLAGCGRLPFLGTPPSPTPVRRVGGLAATPLTSTAVESFGQGLHELGWIEGQNITVDWRWAQGGLDALGALATELVQLNVDVIVTQSQVATAAARRASSTVPIVQMDGGGDLVAAGLVASLARPGGNVTGMTNLAPELTGKRLELLKQTAPGISRVALLAPELTAANATLAREAEAAAVVLGIEVQPLDLNRTEDLDGALDYIGAQRVDGLVIHGTPVTLAQRGRILALVAGRRLPVMYADRRFMDDGGLMAYAPDQSANPRRAAVFVDKILRGASPAELPVERPMRFDFVVNMKTAETLGINFPNEIMLQVTEVLQ